MEYRDAVLNAAQALQRGEDANWQLAQLTYENTNRPHTERLQGRVSHKQWSDDVRDVSGRRFSEQTSRKYAAMWEQFGSTKVRPNWTEAWYEMVPRDSGEPMRSRQTDIHLTEAPAERKAEIFQRLARDPEVMAMPEVSQSIVEAVAKSPGLTAQAINRATEIRPVPQPSPQPAIAANLGYIANLGVSAHAKNAARHDAESVAQLVSWIRKNREELTEGSREAIQENVDGLREVAETYRRYAAEIELAMGGGNSDSWLRSILSEA